MGMQTDWTKGRTFQVEPALSPYVNFPVCLAPMVGLSHVGLRLLVRKYTPASVKTLWPTEMLNSRHLPSEKMGESWGTFKEASENQIMPQILGNDEDCIRKSLEQLNKWGAMGIDINMGCPVSKALRHNYGVALMGDAEYAAEVVAMTVKHSFGPVSVKLRAGLQKDDNYLLGFLKRLEGAGASWLTLHPRLSTQGRRGFANWDLFPQLKRELKIPIVGNGDVQTSEDVWTFLRDYQVDMIMVGRALTARPWLFWQIAEDLGLESPEGRAGEKAPRTPEEEGAEMGRSLLYLMEVLRTYWPEAEALKRLHLHMRFAHGWLEFGHQLRSLLSRAQSLSDAKTTVENFFSKEQRMSPKTQLRD